MDERTYSEFLDLTYSAAVEPDRWRDVLGGLIGSLGAGGGALIEQNLESGQGAGVVAGYAPSDLKPYFGYFATRNVIMRLENPREVVRNYTPRVITDEDRLPKAELLRSEFYNDFLRPLDVHSVLMLGLRVRDLEAATINLTRPRGRDFEAADRALAARLHPHLIRAFNLTRKLTALRQLGGDMADAMDMSPYGLVITDAEGRIRHMNRLAEQLTAEDGGLSVISGRLATARSEESRRLETLIAAAATQSLGGSMPLATATRRLPLSITVAPLRSERMEVFDGGPSAIVCITDLEAGASLPEQRVCELFGLTPAEARVALALLEGGGPRDAAAALGVSFYTVRAHLVRIFEKTGVSRQSDLIRLMMRAIGVNIS